MSSNFETAHAAITEALNDTAEIQKLVVSRLALAVDWRLVAKNERNSWNPKYADTAALIAQSCATEALVLVELLKIRLAE